MNQLKVVITDPATENTYSGSIPRLGDTPANPINDTPAPRKHDNWQLLTRNYQQLRVVDFIPSEYFSETLRGERDAAPYIQEAINSSFKWVEIQYKLFKPKDGVNYPVWPAGSNDSRAFAASSAAKAIPVILPNAELLVESDIWLPQSVSLKGEGFNTARLRFGSQASINVLGQMICSFGYYQPLSGEIDKLDLCPTDTPPVRLIGHIANYRITNNHFESVGLHKHGAGMIEHFSGFILDPDAGNDPTKGAPLRTPLGHLLVSRYREDTTKELTIEGNQFEGGAYSAKLHGSLNLNICNNTTLYTQAAWLIYNSRKVRFNNNNVLGPATGEKTVVEHQAGLIAGGSKFSLIGNQFCDLTLGVALAGEENDFPYFNSWQNVKEGNNGRSALVNYHTWRSDYAFGVIEKNDRMPFPGR